MRHATSLRRHRIRWRMLELIWLCMVPVVVLAIGAVRPVHAQGAEPLYGTWRLVSLRQTVVATGETRDLFGKAPRGFLTYGRDGRIMVPIVKDDRPTPTGAAVDQGEDMGVVEPGADMDLVEEPLVPEHRGELGAQHLERDVTIVLTVSGEIHRGDPTRAELALDRVAASESRSETGGVNHHREGRPGQDATPG